ncbi:MAG TPA: hypothetical protein VGN20_18320 [Mucilaginibacter sp.]
MKSIISGTVIAFAVAICLTLNVQAKSISLLSSATKTAAVSDTGKMTKMGKMDKKKMDKMDKSKKKMSKDTSSKM